MSTFIQPAEERALWHAELLSRAEWMAGADLDDEPFDEWCDDDDSWDERDTTCRYCSGTGGDPWNDGITPCEHCDGEGYEWWQ
jgi:hypothetical protein